MSEIINIWAQHFEPAALIPRGVGARYVIAFRYSLRSGEKMADVKENEQVVAAEKENLNKS